MANILSNTDGGLITAENWNQVCILDRLNV